MQRSSLKKVTISGDKSIGTGEFAQKLELGSINVIIGANAAGKSNFISFFKMLNHIMTGGLRIFVGRNGSAKNFFHFGEKTTPIIEASLEFENKNYTNIYNFSLVKTTDDNLMFSKESIITQRKSDNSEMKASLGEGYRESCLASETVNKPYEKVVKGILSHCRAFQFHDTSDSSHIRSISALDNNRVLMSDGGNLAAYLYMLKNKSDEYCKYYKRIVNMVRCIFPQFDDFVLAPEMLNENTIKLKWKEKDSPDYEFGAEQLSDGSIRFIALATLFLQPPELLPNVIIIDEPELGLHPQAIDVLASMIKIASQHVQVIVATQSPRLIDNFEVNNIIVAEMDSVYHCTVFKQLCEDTLKDWLQDYTNSELWEKNIFGGQP